MSPEFVPGQMPKTREQTKEREVPLVSSPLHPRQLRRGEIGLVGSAAYLGLGQGRWITLSVGSDSGSEGTSTEVIPPGGTPTTIRVTPGGADGAVQYNNGGVFGGFGTYDDVTLLLTIAQMVASNYLRTPEIKATGDLKLNPTGDVVIPEGTAIIFNG